MIRIGDDGGICVAPESTYGTPGTVFAWQHTVGGSESPKRELLRSNRLQRTRPPVEYNIPYGEGGVVVEYDKTLAVIGDLLRLFGVEGTGDLLIDGNTPDLESATLRVNHGGYMLQYAGFMGGKIRFDLDTEKPVQVTVEGLGGDVTYPSPVTPSLPSDAGIVFPSDLGAVTVGAATIIIKSAVIEAGFEIQGTGRKGIGRTSLMQPFQSGFTCTGTLNVELGADSGNDTEAILEKFIDGTVLGDISLDGGDILCATAYMVGDAPQLQAGAQEFPINFDAASLLLDSLV